MSTHRSLAAALWLLAAICAWATAALWADDAQTGKIQPWALVVVFWAAALISVTIHHLSRCLAEYVDEAADAARRYRAILGPAARLHAATLSARLAHGADAVARAGRRSWAQQRTMLALQARTLSALLAQGPDALTRYWVLHRPAGAYLSLIRGVSDQLAHAPDAFKRYWAGRGQTLQV